MATKSDAAPAVGGVEERLVDTSVGRGLFATRNFKEGEVIFEENPVVSCQFLYNKEYGYSACQHCLRPLETAEVNVRRLCQDPTLSLPHSHARDTPPSAVHCPHCPHCQEQYCSELCMESAWQQYHRTLCFTPGQQHPLEELQHEWKQHHYPPETLSILLPARLLAGIIQSPDPASTSRQLSQYCHATSCAEQGVAHRLLGEEFEKHVHVLRECMTRIFTAPETEQWLTPEGFLSLLALVGSNAQGVGSSPLARWVRRCDELDLGTEERRALDLFIDHLYERLEETVGSFLNTEGSALYRLQSRLNHSCRPNASSSFPHNCHRLSLTALRPIACGEQVTISYLDECALRRSRHSRHAALRENYVFVCRCERCLEEEEQPDVTSEEESDEEEEEELTEPRG